MKNLIKTTLIVLISFQLMGCAEECTEESLKAKSLEIAEKMQKVAASGDMNKIMRLAQKMGKFKNMAQDEDNLHAACELVDELLDEL